MILHSNANKIIQSAGSALYSTEYASSAKCLAKRSSACICCCRPFKSPVTIWASSSADFVGFSTRWPSLCWWSWLTRLHFSATSMIALFCVRVTALYNFSATSDTTSTLVELNSVCLLNILVHRTMVIFRCVTLSLCAGRCTTFACRLLYAVLRFYKQK